MHSVDPFSLLPVDSSLELFDFFSLELTSLLLSVSIADGSLIAVYIVEGILIFHELAVVLFVD